MRAMEATNTTAAKGTFDTVGATDFLEHDDRPTFVLDLEPAAAAGPQLPPPGVYANPSLRNIVGLWDRIRGVTAKELPTHDDMEFIRWAVVDHSCDGSSGEQRASSSVVYAGREWTTRTLKGRWRIVYSVSWSTRSLRQGASSRSTDDLAGHSDAAVTPSLQEQGDSHVDRLPGSRTPVASAAKSDARCATTVNGDSGFASLDWISSPPHDSRGHVKFLLDFDWKSTPLGPMADWQPNLRRAVMFIVADPNPNLILWGEELYVVYNEACLSNAAFKHPHALGNPYFKLFPEVEPLVRDMYDGVRKTGKAVKLDPHRMEMERNGSLEEVYYSATVLPILSHDDGRTVGLMQRFTDATEVVVAERRMITLRKLGEYRSTANDINGVWRHFLATLELNTDDIPFAILYVASEDTSEDSTSFSAAKPCYLEGVVGIEAEHPAAVKTFDLSIEQAGFAPYCRESWATGQPVFLQSKDNTLPSSLNVSVTGRCSDDLVNSAVVCSIPSLARTHVTGFLVLGLAPKRPYDEEYKSFIRFLNSCLVEASASFVLPEETRRYKLFIEDMSIRHASLTKRTQQAERDGTVFTTLANLAPVGMFIFQPDGTSLFLNDAYVEQTGLKGANVPMGWEAMVYPDDLQHCQTAWRTLVEEKAPLSFDYRSKRMWMPESAVGISREVPRTFRASVFPELDEDGSVRVIVGWQTDVSLEKHLEHLQKQRLEEALETKRQSETFIDMTSHEMRNPLSAILQSAEAILAALGDKRSVGPTAESGVRHIEECDEAVADSAQTILLCAQHQKRIVDDILTLSKLDSNLLLITPDRSQPVAICQHVLTMYKAELESANIKIVFSIEKSYTDLEIDSVVLDHSRLMQVLINLLTNAIKFTQSRGTRQITITLDASYTRPTGSRASSGMRNVSFFPRKLSRPELSMTADWGDGQDIFIQFDVEDTGIGLSEEEIRLLFLRFKQATPKTHVKYGGSGLGLFISRELTELQGGQIGVASEPGKGSTFTFYVKARRAVPSSPITPSTSSTNGQAPVNIHHQHGPHSKSSLLSPRAAIASYAILPPDLPGARMPDSRAGGRSSLHVLIVEDNLINQKVMAQQIRRLGCIVHVAGHGVEALEFLATTTFSPFGSGIRLSVILMDLEMPVMDGLTCVSRIRDMQAAGELIGHVPVVAVTANARSEQIDGAMKKGMDLVVTKPFRIPELLPKIEELINRLACE